MTSITTLRLLIYAIISEFTDIHVSMMIPFSIYTFSGLKCGNLLDRDIYLNSYVKGCVMEIMTHSWNLSCLTSSFTTKPAEMIFENHINSGTLMFIFEMKPE